MKLSISLTEEDVAILDRYMAESGLESRSAVIQQAVRRLPDKEMGAAYSAAFKEWADSADSADWDAVSADGRDDAAR